MPPKPRQLKGQRFGRLVAIAWQTGPGRTGGWLCRCDCGELVVKGSSVLLTGRARSCGCLRPSHGGKGSRAYAIWRSMLDRCTEPSHKNWADYGGRGIAVCERWRESFAAFRDDMGQPPVGLTLERIDNSRGYEPGNCRWASRKEQARNTRRTRLIEFDGREQSLAAWAEELEANYFTLYTRLVKLGWPPERAFADFL